MWINISHNNLYNNVKMAMWGKASYGLRKVWSNSGDDGYIYDQNDGV